MTFPSLTFLSSGRTIEDSFVDNFPIGVMTGDWNSLERVRRDSARKLDFSLEKKIRRIKSDIRDDFIFLFVKKEKKFETIDSS